MKSRDCRDDPPETGRGLSLLRAIFVDIGVPLHGLAGRAFDRRCRWRQLPLLHCGLALANGIYGGRRVLGDREGLVARTMTRNEFRGKWRSTREWPYRWPAVIVYPALVLITMFAMTVGAWIIGLGEVGSDVMGEWTQLPKCRRDWKSVKDKR